MWRVPFLIIYGILAAITAVITVGNVVWADNEDFVLNLTPTKLYDNTSMNYFGCIVTWIGIVIINPIWWGVVMLLIGVGYAVFTFFNWLFTTGRKNK